MSAPRPHPEGFVFPTHGPLPYRDPRVGIALGKGATRGVFQAGVVHALVMCGYFPGVVAGTSAGCVNGAFLALASELDDREKQLELVSELILAWEKNPAANVLDRLIHGPLGALSRDLLDIDLPLGEIVGLVGQARDLDIAALTRLILALPLGRPRLVRALLSAVGGALVGVVRGESALRMAQGFLSAYGMERSLVPGCAVENNFAQLIERFAPRGRDTTFGDLKRTHLVLQVADLSEHDQDRSEVQLIEISRPSDPTRPDFSSAKLLAAMRASCAFAPLFEGVRARELTAHLPPGRSGDDLLMDAAVVEKDPLSPLISHWARQRAEGPFRLFAVYHDPIGEVEAKVSSPFLGHALHSLMLRDRLDQRYPAKVVSMMTEMVEAIQEKKASLPPRLGGGRYVAVHTTEIAPRTMLPFGSLSVPPEKELMEACASGCRSTLEALFAPLIRSLDEKGKVPCAKLLEAARAAQEGSPDKDRYFRPLPKVCEHCTGMLEPSPPPTARGTPKDVAKVNDFKFFHEENRKRAPSGGPEPLTVVVPAGGVFLGVFQIGAIAALKQYKIRPDLYAGASVGTLFSYLLHACLENERRELQRIIDLVLRIPAWVDAADQPKGDGVSPPGLVDAIVNTVSARWRSAALAPLRELRPREITKMLGAKGLLPGSEEERTWVALRGGLSALLFTPIPDRRTGQARSLPPSYGLDVGDICAVQELFQNLERIRLADALPLLDRIAANLDIFHPDTIEDEGEVIGFTSIGRELRGIVFPDGDRTLSCHSNERRARFIFTVTNHTRGHLEQFGFDEGITPLRSSPNAVEACLAASSFPLAFRRRTRQEIFRSDAVDEPKIRYADGGIFNNFPSDTAFAYLHALTGEDAEHSTRWIGVADHRVILLSLTSPSMLPDLPPGDDRLFFNLARATAKSEDEKVKKTQRSQEHINALATVANPLLREQGKRQAIRAEMELISPAYTIYPHAFAFKEYLGFDSDKQLEMIASGCRRARLTLEWGIYQDAPRPRKGEAPRDAFMREVRAEVARTTGPFSPYPEDMCVFGRFNPDNPKPIQCPFASELSTRAVFAACKRTVDRELSVPDPKLYPKLIPRRPR